ncbi:uncharacterized protein EAF01_005293 [Botrytis porri]|uniref:uncharacterized protein n=1 Tax=Botrytis porri TaxID=87229 RepID=UPI0018FF7574|nr:uncharacterized protein EAF01_005293 [Botrytis porri]KAF7907707.1 hypothetical protein EAF01_005293 [Botrytis porri]
MKVLFHNPITQNFVGKNIWRVLSQEEGAESFGEMMADFEYKNQNIAILPQTYANVLLQLAAFEAHAQTQGFVDRFGLFVDGMFMSMDQRTNYCLGEISMWEREVNKKRLEDVRADACNPAGKLETKSAHFPHPKRMRRVLIQGFTTDPTLYSQEKFGCNGMSEQLNVANKTGLPRDNN